MSRPRAARTGHASHALLVAVGLMHHPTVLAGEVDAQAIEAITPASQPVLHDAWGADWVERINRMLVKAAGEVSNSKSCDRVRRCALDHGRSVVRQRIAIVVECDNQRRFNIEVAQPLMQGAGS